MDRQPPRTISDEIDLYIRTYYSLLRSSGEVRVRAFEEAHSYSDSSLHAGAREVTPDVAAFAYSAARLPECMPSVRRLVLGQSVQQFETAGHEVADWAPVRARGRRRAMRWDGDATLAVFVTSVSDIDDLVPIVTAYQIEWNKMHGALARSSDALALAEALGLPEADVVTLQAALGGGWEDGVEALRAGPLDIAVRLLNGSFNEYQSTAQRWWTEIGPAYTRRSPAAGPTRPVYFVSSNTHSLANLIGGYARAHRDDILDFARRHDPEDLRPILDRALAQSDEDTVSNVLYYLLRAYLHDPARDADPAELRSQVQAFDGESGITSVESPGKVDVDAQLFELGKLRPERLDPRVRIPGVERLAASDAVIVNIDYPLGMAAYHHLTRLSQGVGELRGIYVLGKAATLNGRVGDVMVLKAVHDEHSKNTYLVNNCFAASDVQPYMTYGTVLDNQKAVTVRGAYLQNREYMSVFYNEGYTIMEMEAGPYLSAVYELLNPTRHPDDEIVNLGGPLPFDVGFLHYASDTPYSRRQSLLSKSMSFFGVESTYGCAIATLRRVLSSELARLDAR